MTEKEIVKLREILGRIIIRSEHNPDLNLIKSLAIEADTLIKESEPTVDGDAFEQCGYSPTECEECGWSPCDQSC